MNPKYDRYLCAKYPVLYRGRHKSPEESLMGFGFAVGDGWFPLINRLSYQLSARWLSAKQEYEKIKDRLGELRHPLEDPIDTNQIITIDLIAKKAMAYASAERSVPEVIQVKEKFGSLRFYATGTNEEQEAMISFAEDLSGTICEVCGSMKGRMTDKGWVKCLCKNCRGK